MTEHLRAYNSLWQVRSDSWCRLEEAADRLTRPYTTGALKEKYVSACQELLARAEHLRALLGLTQVHPNSRASNGFSPPAAMTSSRRRLCGSTAR